jgi:hypothetical protein
VSDQERLDERLDEIEAELAADAARPLKITAVDRDSGEVVEGVVFRDHAIAAGLDELGHDDDDAA